MKKTPLIKVSLYCNKTAITSPLSSISSFQSNYLIVSTNEKRCLIKRHHLFILAVQILLSQPFSCFCPFSNDGFQALTKFEKQRKQKNTYLQLVQQVTQTKLRSDSLPKISSAITGNNTVNTVLIERPSVWRILAFTISSKSFISRTRFSVCIIHGFYQT